MSTLLPISGRYKCSKLNTSRMPLILNITFFEPSLSLRNLVKSGLFLSLLSLSACNHSDDGGGGGPAAVNPPIIKKVTKESYLSGAAFCNTYKEITGKEVGKFIEVPKDYSNPSKGNLKIYAHTLRAFDPSKESYIFVDGGPGQNTHGEIPEYFIGKINEIRFDQRGVGCSAPETYEEYIDQSQYSSENTIRDMELIRQAYGINQWSIYGISYGTVPGTMYAAKYPQATKSLVLEGVFGRPDQVHLWSYKAEKLNLVLAKLNSEQRKSFTTILNEDSDDTSLVISILFDLFYSDKGMRTAVLFIKNSIQSDGKIDRDYLKEVRDRVAKKDKKYPSPQQPGVVDENILNILYCKNLDKRHQKAETISYSHEKGFFPSDSKNKNKYQEACDSVGVREQDEAPYKLEDYKVTSPVYYFQGSHDGATLAIGARTHWKTVPQKESYFMLAQKGGHNPNLARLEFIKDEENKKLSEAQNKLYFLALTNDQEKIGLTNSINEVNKNTEFKWLLLDNNNKDSAVFDTELEGITYRSYGYL